MLAIPWFLNPAMQGYWFTFISLAGFSGLANLGFSTIVMQFSAHEFAFLHFSEDGSIAGDSGHLVKLACFFKFVLKWVGWTLVLVFPIIMIAGWYFLKQRSGNINWQLPWFLYSLVTAWLFINSSLGCFFQGCDSVKKIQSIELKGAIATTITTLSCLYLGFGLNTLVISTFIHCLVVFYLLVIEFKILILQLLHLSSNYSYSWFKEFFSLMWRYAISWSSGMLMTQLFTPLAFNFYGPVVAGKIGFTMTLWTSAKWLVYSFFTSAIPKINMMAELKEWIKMDKFVRGRFFTTVGLYILGSATFFILYIIFYDKFFVFKRLADFWLILAICINEFCSLIINNGEIYLRAFKEDPTMPISVVVGIFIALSSYYIAQNFNSVYLFLGSLMAYIFFSIPVIFWMVYKRYKKHKK